MYRELVDTRKGFEALIGRLVRLEWSGDIDSSYIGIITRVNDEYVFFNRANGSRGDLKVIAGAYAVYVTTTDAVIPADEQPHSPVRWRNRVHRYDPVLAG